VADQRVGAGTRLQVIDALLSGTHEPGSSHHDLLRAFVPADVLARVDAALATHGYRTHEFGDSVLIRDMRTQRPASSVASPGNEGPIAHEACVESLH
jgi:S-adenosylmethionine:tRNA ribosyltransferase-isomerase